MNELILGFGKANWKKPSIRRVEGYNTDTLEASRIPTRRGGETIDRFAILLTKRRNVIHAKMNHRLDLFLKKTKASTLDDEQKLQEWLPSDLNSNYPRKS